MLAHDANASRLFSRLSLLVCIQQKTLNGDSALLQQTLVRRKHILRTHQNQFANLLQTAWLRSTTSPTIIRSLLPVPVWALQLACLQQQWQQLPVGASFALEYRECTQISSSQLSFVFIVREIDARRETAPLSVSIILSCVWLDCPLKSCSIPQRTGCSISLSSVNFWKTVGKTIASFGDFKTCCFKKVALL